MKEPLANPCFTQSADDFSLQNCGISLPVAMHHTRMLVVPFSSEVLPTNQAETDTLQSRLSLSEHRTVSPSMRPAAAALKDAPELFRLFIKNGEYVYARANDIVMIESCDHLVKVHLAIDSCVKKAVRNNTLKDFLSQLPQEQFRRIGRFCAVNTARLSGGNCKEQTFEFDFKVVVKLKKPISPTQFAAIGK